MNVQSLKPKLGRWLFLEDLKNTLSEIPEDTGNEIPVNRKLLETASDFVEEKNAGWDHADWAGFLARLEGQGFKLSDSSRDHVGRVLEVFKSYYQQGDFEAVREKKRKPAPPPRRGRSR